jgi:hypothetical protein
MIPLIHYGDHKPTVSPCDQDATDTCVSCFDHCCCVLLFTYDLHQANNDLIKSYCDEIKIIGLSISNDSKVYIAVKYVQIKVSKHAN